jgi:hypothetical protein
MVEVFGISRGVSGDSIIEFAGQPDKERFEILERLFLTGAAERDRRLVRNAELLRDLLHSESTESAEKPGAPFS